MSLKDDLKAVKDELNSEEKFLENAIKTERFVKRYKTPLIIASIAVLIGIVSNVGYGAYNDSVIERSNSALFELLEDSKNESAKLSLKDANPKLYDLWSMSNSIKEGDYSSLEALKNSNASIVSDISSYEAALSKNDTALLEEYTKKESAIFKDLANIELAIELFGQDKISEAHSKLSLISKDSTVYNVAEVLMHYGVK